jgi:multiple antibiotic resistance protein
MIQNFILTFTGIFVALDAIGMAPLYVSMTLDMPLPERSRMANTSMAVALGVALVFLFFGGLIFRFLGIEVPDFKIAGGLVLLLVSLADLLGGPDAVQRGSGSTGIVPLAVPLITGPAILTTIILHVETVGYGITIAAVLANYFIAWILLKKAERVTSLLGKDGTMVISKLAALLLAAIAVSMIRRGVFDLIHIPKG